MVKWYTYFIAVMFVMFPHSQTIAEEEFSSMEPIPRAKNLITEIWCVDGYRVLYVEKTTNETFQFFQVTQNAGIAVKAIECDNTEVRTVK